MVLRSFFSLPVFIVLTVFITFFIETAFFVIDPWLGLNTAKGLMNALFFFFTTFMAAICYVLAVVSDPGCVPAGYVPDSENSSAVICEVKRKGGQVRYCQKCVKFKPPRAHHCRICKRCVLKMDHHCVWINNCVGFRNYKAFFLFVMYAEISLVHSMILMASQLFLDGSEEQSEGRIKGTHHFLINLEPTSTMLKLICGSVVGPLSISLGVLLAWHVHLCLENKTTIEHHEGVRAKWLAKKTGTGYLHPYDMGVVNNLHGVFGPLMICWLFPTLILQADDGLHFGSSVGNSTEIGE